MSVELIKGIKERDAYFILQKDFIVLMRIKGGRRNRRRAEITERGIRRQIGGSRFATKVRKDGSGGRAQWNAQGGVERGRIGRGGGRRGRRGLNISEEELNGVI